MKKNIGMSALLFAVLSFASVSSGQMINAEQKFDRDNVSQIQWIAVKPLLSFIPLGVAPALMFPSCKAPSGLVLLGTVTDESGGGEKAASSPHVASLTTPQEIRPQTLLVYPLTKDGPAQQPCVIQDTKARFYEPTPGSLLSAFPRA